jgi:very-short-patch-repair endonuclease
MEKLKRKRPSRCTGGENFCEECSKGFYVTFKRINKARFCSMNCYHTNRRKNNPLIGFKHSEISKEHYRNKIFTKTHRENLSRAAKNRIVSDKTKEKIRKNTIKQHLNGLFPQTNTIIERMMEKEMIAQGILFKHPFPFGRFVCDFAIPECKLIVECDGDYWHNREDIKKKDKAKNTYLKVSGWRILRFWEHEIKADVVKCVNTIKETICNN